MASIRDAATAASVPDERPQMNLERVVSAARASVARGGTEVRLRLHPETLGEVRVQVRWEGGTLSARLEAATPAGREALEQGAPALRAALQEHGIPVEQLSVNLRMDSDARPQHRPPASDRVVHEAPERDRPTRTDAVALSEPALNGRVDIRI
jgi:flagellar hook-length control protein FliK